MAVEALVLGGLDLNQLQVAELTNLITNPNAQGGETPPTVIDGWTPRGQNNADFTQATFGDGSKAFRLIRDTDAGGADTIYMNSDPATPAAPGQWVGIACEMSKNGSYADAPGSVSAVGDVGGTQGAATVATVTEAWTRLTNVVQVEAGVTRVNFRAGFNTVDEGSVYYVRRVIACIADTQAEATAAIASYFDGDTPGYHWTGAEHASSSTFPVEDTNLVPNPSSEVTPSATSFSGSGGGLADESMVQSATNPKVGTYSSRWTVNRNEAGTIPLVVGRIGSGLTGTIPVTPDAMVGVRVSLTRAGANPWVSYRARIYWYKADGTQSADTISDGLTITANPTLNSRQDLYVAAIVPADAAYAAPTPYITVTPGGVDTQYVADMDGYMLVSGLPDTIPTGASTVATDIPEYFDGDTDTARWDGTPHASISVPQGQWSLESFTLPPATKRYDRVSGADSDGSRLIRPPRYDDAVLELRLRLAQQTTMDEALDLLGGLTNKLQEAELLAAETGRGMEMVWTPADSTYSRTLYVHGGEIIERPIAVQGDDAGWLIRSPVVTVRLACEPFMYGAEVTGTAVTAATPVVSTTVANVAGDVPAEATLVVTDAASKSRRFVEWGLEQRGYNAATPLLIDSDSLVVSGYAGASAARSGAYLSNVVRATLTTSPVMVCSTGDQLHVGSWRVRARVYATSGTRVRLAYRAGDAPFTRNAYAAASATNAFCEMDLGTIHIAEAQTGTQRWQGLIEAYSTTATDVLDIDYIALIPAGEGYGQAYVAAVYETSTTFSVRDEFNQAAGALAGKAIAVAGAISGPRSPTTAVNVAGAGADWSNPTYVTANDSNRASVVIGDGATSDPIKITGFGFTIPAGATIGGVVVSVVRRARSGDNCRDSSVKLVKAGAIIGTEHASGANWPVDTDATAVYGTSNDMWGTTWTLAEINAADFGVQISAFHTGVGDGVTADINHVTVTVFYTPSGGQTWTGAEDADDFSVDSVTHTLQRTAVSDTSEYQGRYAIAGTTVFTDVAVQTDLTLSTSDDQLNRHGVFARYIDTSNWLMGVYAQSGILLVIKRVAASFTTLLDTAGTGLSGTTNVTLRLVADRDGRWFLWADGRLFAGGTDTDLATGGALASGMVGIYDSQVSATARTRTFDNFQAFIPVIPDAVLFAGYQLEVRSDDTERADVSGAYWGRPQSYRGSRFFLPPGGDQGLTSRVAVIARRNHLEEMAEPNVTDSTTIRVDHTPRWWVNPRA